MPDTEPRTQRTWWWFHPIVAAAIWPVDLGQRAEASLDSLWHPLSLSLGLVVFWWGLFALAIGGRRAAFVATWLALAPWALFAAPPLYSTLLQAIGMLAVAAIVRSEGIHTFLNGLVVVLLGSGIVSSVGGDAIHRSGQAVHWEPSPFDAPSGHERPDVYMILLDGHAREDVLERRFGVAKAQGLAEHLRLRDFTVSDDVRTNYMQTKFTLGSMLNLAYVDQVALHAPHMSPPVEDYVRKNRTIRTFRESGYVTQYWYSGFPQVFMDADVQHAPPVPHETLDVFIRSRSLLFVAVDSMRGDVIMARAHRRATIIKYALNELAPAAAGDPPQFHFLHVMAPHPSFVLDAEGRVVAAADPGSPWDHLHWEQANPGVSYADGYQAQARAVRPLVTEAVDRILATERGNDAIIVVFGDHGSGLGADFEHLADEALVDRCTSLWAVRLPGGERATMPPDMTLLDGMAGVLHEALGVQLPPRASRSYQHSYEAPFDLVDVTEKVRALESTLTRSANAPPSD